MKSVFVQLLIFNLLLLNLDKIKYIFAAVIIKRNSDGQFNFRHVQK